MERMGGRERGCKTNVVAFKKKRRRKEEGASDQGRKKRRKKAVEVFPEPAVPKCFVRIS